jgi:hypothetical protein
MQYLRAMGEYGRCFSKIRKHLLADSPLAQNNEKGVAEALNALTKPFILDKDLPDLAKRWSPVGAGIINARKSASRPLD